MRMFRCVLQLYTTTLIGFLVSRSRVRDTEMSCRRHLLSYSRIRRVIAICAAELHNEYKNNVGTADGSNLQLVIIIA